jgi:hypothetical protein
MEKTNLVGWLLIFLGVSIILWTLFVSYNVFLLEKEAPGFFKSEEETALVDDSSFSFKTMEQEMNRIVGEQIKDMLPTDAFSRILNLFVWSIFAGIFIFGGGQIANIGIKIIRSKNNGD